MSKPTAAHPFPRAVLLGAAALVGVTMVLAAASRIGGLGRTEPPAAEAAASLDLHFEDGADGGVSVIDADTDRLVATIASGDGGFIRGVLRGLVRERRSRGIGPEPPFRLTRWANGRLSLEDPATGARVHLEAFGQTQVQAFAELMISEDHSQ